MKFFKLIKSLFSQKSEMYELENDFELIDAGFGDCSSDCSSDCVSGDPSIFQGSDPDTCYIPSSPGGVPTPYPNQ